MRVMGTRWEQKPWDPEITHARPPARPQTDWAKVWWIVGFPITTWTLVLLVLWVEVWS